MNFEKYPGLEVNGVQDQQHYKEIFTNVETLGLKSIHKYKCSKGYILVEY
jgi:hypothetical protein